MDGVALGRLGDARAQAGKLAWAQRIETRGGLPEASAGGRTVPGLVLDLDASIVLCHSEKGRRVHLHRLVDGSVGDHDRDLPARARYCDWLRWMRRAGGAHDLTG
jgi:hypothetical protein